MLSIIFSVLSCSKKEETYKGDLFFKLINLHATSGYSIEKVKEIERILDTLNLSKFNNKGEIYFYKELLKLKKNNLLQSPYILLKSDKDVKKVYLNTDEYKKLNDYKLDYLQKKHLKVKIELNIKELDSGIYFSNKIINIKEVDGETLFKK